MSKGILFVAAGVALLVAGCGHNVIQYGDGVGFDLGVNPENYTLSLNMRYGKILSAVTRDNVEIEVTGSANADAATGGEVAPGSKVSTDGNMKIKIGRQINGAAVDLVKAGADPDKVVEALKDKTASSAK